MTAHAASSGTFDVKEKSIAELQSAMQAGKATSQQLVQLYLARIAALDKAGPTLNSIIELNPDALMPAGPTLSTAQVIAKLRSGWSLLSAGEVLTPRQFNDLLTQTTSLPGVVPLKLVSLWAWDSSRANWYFFSPDLDALGSNALADYAASNGYLDFNALGKSLEPNMGFWVRIR